MAYNTNRKEDSRLEQITNDFLNKYFFNTDFEDVRWANTREEQLKGIDIYLTSEKYGLENAKVDIKSAVKYSDKYLGTYALELSFIGRNYNERIGWFLNDELDTEYYFLLYPRSKKHYTEIETYDDIDYIDYYLIEKSAIYRFLNSRGYDKKRLEDVVSEMRDNFKTCGNNKLILESGSANFHFSLSGFLAEQPINIVLKRDVYDRYAKIKGRIEKA